ncbi:LysR family transcriptional regulator [Niastella yeongjuensis]|uniref:LysR family transcriptional regulator n=1 Tax=Niastella yeongjuensis TaxID=354355 RepID=A0A1V9EA27_9BACT|nr:LysR family transcriptional regulator [Niastella yeongjuensis]OQP42942.1 LysR family transcriptional regulator [Niastella yeongjuensis]SEO60350.1 DNA-binding transcriptional regulator, LysR family [Niastella yeongjuensis]
MLNLEWLRTFKTIYETGNLSAAAQELYISQPGVSLHLRSLETYTGYRLFERETRKMIPTERAIILYNCIFDSLNTLTQVEQTICRNSKVDKPTIGVGMGFEMFEQTLEEHIAKLPFNLIMKFGEYGEMLHDLDTGALDLVLTAKKGQQLNLEYTPFTKERIVLICGSETATSALNELILEGKTTHIRQWLKEQIWFTTAADMEHLKHFYLANFDCLPDFKPNYVVPNFGSILRCLQGGKGFAVMPDFLCKKEIESKTIKLAWEGCSQVENTLHFAKRKKTMHPKEIRQLEELLTGNWFA